MKRSRKQIRIRLKQGASFLLVLLFLSIAAAPILHEHNDSHPQEQQQRAGQDMQQVESITAKPDDSPAAYVITNQSGLVISDYKSNWAVEQSGIQEQLQLSDKCSVCDYYHHIQGKQWFSYDHLELPAIFSKVISTSPHLFTGNYKITVQGFTNKGPPQTA